MSHVLTKSAKGLREASGKTQELPYELREVLKLCRGQFVAEELVADVPLAEQEAVAGALVVLAQTGYLREVMEIETEGLASETDVYDELSVFEFPDAGRNAAMSDSLAQQLRAEVAARRGQRDDETSEQVRQAEAAARQRAEEKSRLEAAELARQEAEERAKREAEARARSEAEEKVRLETLERERAEAEEKAKFEAAERTRRAADEKAKKDAAERARREADARARREAEERELEEMRERIRQRGMKRRRIAIPLLAASLVGPVALVLSVGLIPFEGKRKEFEGRASQMLAAPVKIGSAHFVLVPKPQWQLAQVGLGEGATAVRINRADVSASVASLWSLPESFSALHLDAPTVPLAVLPSLFGEATQTVRLPVTEVTGTGLLLMGSKPVSPPMTFSAAVEAGKFANFSAQGQDPDIGRFAMSAEAVSNVWKLRIQAGQCEIPFGIGKALTDCAIEASFTPTAMNVSRFTGRMYNGDLVVTGQLSWAGPWQGNGTVELTRVDASQWAPAWFKDGFASGTAEFSASGQQPDDLLSGLHIAGKFAIAPGTLNQVDLDRLVQGRGTGEQSRFASLEGNVVFDQGRADFSGLVLTAGALRADGAISIDAAQVASGRLALEVKTGAVRLAMPVTVSGTLAKPDYQR